MMDKKLSDTTAVMVDGDPSKATLNNGMDVSVYVCNARTLPHLLRFIGRVATDMELKLSNTEAIEQQLLAKLDDVGFLLQLIADYSEPIYQLIDRLTDLAGVDTVEALDIDDLIIVIDKIVKVNRGFFTERVLPMFLKALAENR
jgi:hypothetical protein